MLIINKEGRLLRQVPLFYTLCSFQPDNVAPAGCGVLTTEVVFDGIGKDISFSYAVSPCVLLTAQDDGF